ncbi:MAG: DNA repair protein RecN [Eubacteriaceae bacterium]|nr:DNA repair protein RecN [Eubacteriaceae bacterium]
MLESLEIQDYAIIDKLSINFYEGLNVLTGETGAGKSIIVGALGLALGARASASMVRAGCQKASIQAVFFLGSGSGGLDDAANELGIDISEGTLVVRREVFANGKSVARANDSAITTNSLKLLASFLVDLHGQHEHQRLLDERFHLACLDELAFAVYGSGNLLDGVAVSHAKLSAATKAYKTAKSDIDQAKLSLEENRRLLSELEQARLTPGMDDEIESRIRTISSAEKLNELIDGAYGLSYASARSAIELLTPAIQMVEKAMEIDEKLSGIYKSLEEAHILVQDASEGMRDYLSVLEYEPGEMERLQTTLSQINSLKRKHQGTLEDLINLSESLAAKIALASADEFALAEAEEALNDAQTEYSRLAGELSAVRNEAAQSLSSSVEEILADLSMPNARFQVELGALPNPSPNGMDSAKFQVSLNMGQPPRPLAKTASGGEISRIMLALKSILAATDDVGTLVFDEIDTGVSGRTAQSVAQHMQGLASTRQVICITHLPQIAAMADSHYLIEKGDGISQPLCFLSQLDEKGRIDELARIIGGAQLTDATLGHASDLIGQASAFKQRA